MVSSVQIEGGEGGEFPLHWLVSSPLLVHKMAFQGGKIIFPPTVQGWDIINISSENLQRMLWCNLFSENTHCSNG